MPPTSKRPGKTFPSQFYLSLFLWAEHTNLIISDLRKNFIYEFAAMPKKWKPRNFINWESQDQIDGVEIISKLEK